MPINTTKPSRKGMRIDLRILWLPQKGHSKTSESTNGVCMDLASDIGQIVDEGVPPDVGYISGAILTLAGLAVNSE